MSQGRFILSLDCEGKWGIADHLTPKDDELLSDTRLRRAYGDIVALLDRIEIPSTFAVVGLFQLSPSELAALPHEEIAVRLPYTAEAMRRIGSGDFDGWHGEWLAELLGKHHEIASHGVTHTPFDQMDHEAVTYELSLTNIPQGQTFIFPRNRVAHLDALERAGFCAYREAKPSTPIGRLLGEFNIFESSEAELRQPNEGIAPIAAGHFVNWKAGARKYVPLAVTRRRAAHMLDDAVRTGGVVHFWTHPENIASSPATLDVLRVILEEVKTRRDRGEILVQTQIDHVRLAA